MTDVAIESERSSASTADRVEPTIRFDGVGKQFDDTWVLRDIDLDIRPGTIHGLVGPSGCGKTTTVRLALGYHRADEGTVTVLGADPVSRSNHERKQIGYLPQHPVLFEELTLLQNMNFHAALHGVRLKRSDRLQELLELVDLTEHQGKRVSEASGGMKRRLALAATLISEPPLLLLDEPTAGVDPILRRQLWDELRRIRDAGTTLVVTTQFVEEAAYCDEVAVLADGEIQANASPPGLVEVAYGGRRFDVQCERAVGGSAIEAIAGIDGIVSASAAGPRSIRIGVAMERLESTDDGTRSVDDSIRAAIGDAVADNEVVAVAEVAVDWNDVFAAIVTDDDQIQPRTDSSDETAPDDDDPEFVAEHDMEPGDEERSS